MCRRTFRLGVSKPLTQEDAVSGCHGCWADRLRQGTGSRPASLAAGGMSLGHAAVPVLHLVPKPASSELSQ